MPPPLQPIPMLPFSRKPEINWENEWIRSRGDVLELRNQLKQASTRIDQLRHSDAEAKELKMLHDLLGERGCESLEEFVVHSQQRYEAAESLKNLAEARVQQDLESLQDLEHSNQQLAHQKLSLEQELQAATEHIACVDEQTANDAARIRTLQAQLSCAQVKEEKLVNELEQLRQAAASRDEDLIQRQAEIALLQGRSAQDALAHKDLSTQLSSAQDKLAVSDERAGKLEQDVASIKLRFKEAEAEKNAVVDAAGMARNELELQLQNTLSQLEQANTLHSNASARAEGLEENLSQQRTKWSRNFAKLDQKCNTLSKNYNETAAKLAAAAELVAQKEECIQALKAEMAAQQSSHQNLGKMIHSQLEIAIRDKEGLRATNADLCRLSEESLSKVCQLEFEVGSRQEDLDLAQDLYKQAQAHYDIDLGKRETEIGILRQALQDGEMAAAAVRQEGEHSMGEQIRLSSELTACKEQIRMQSASFQERVEALKMEHFREVRGWQAQVEQFQLSEVSAEEQNERYQELSSQLVNTEALVKAKSSEVSTLEAKIQSATAEREKLMLRLETYANLEVLGNDHVRQNEALRSQLLLVEGAKREVEKCLNGESKLRRQLQERLLDIKGTIRVFCRLRPPNKDETYHDGSYTLNPNNRGLSINQIVNGQQQRHTFEFDQVFDKSSTNADIFAEVDLLIQSAFNGFNACVFAYGQTGSGKTHTMLSEDGIVYRSMRTLFDLVDTMRLQFEVRLSATFMEIYNEKVFDLLGGSDDAKDLAVLECRNLGQLESVLLTGLRKRKVASTAMNSRSSRSHTIFSIIVESRDRRTNVKTRGKVNLIDLAGSERVKQSRVAGQQLQEAKAINTSLSALGNVIQALAAKQKFVPFRSSKLTYSLQESLQGKCKTLMLVNLSPSLASLGESLTSLRFAENVNLVKLDRSK